MRGASVARRIANRPRVCDPARTPETGARLQSRARRRADAPAVSSTNRWRASATHDPRSGSEAIRRCPRSDWANPIQTMANSSARRVGSREYAAARFQPDRSAPRPRTRNCADACGYRAARECRPRAVRGARTRTPAVCSRARGCRPRAHYRSRHPGSGRQPAQRLPPQMNHQERARENRPLQQSRVAPDKIRGALDRCRTIRVHARTLHHLTPGKLRVKPPSTIMVWAVR